MRQTIAIILAAGQSTRMNSGFSKVLHKIYGKTMLDYVLDAARPLNVRKSIIVTSGQLDIKKNYSGSKNIQFVTQRRLLGTGHAAAQTKKTLSGFRGDVLILYGDTPLLTSTTLRRLLEKHKGSLAACTLLTAVLKHPEGYGRIIRDADHKITRIVEERDASIYERAIEEINTGVYCFRARELYSIIHKIKTDNKKGEYYLTDAVSLLAKQGYGIENLQTDNIHETIGVNSRQDLAKAQEFTKNRILDDMMSMGVGIIDPLTTHIYNDVEIGQDTVIYPFTVIESDVRIGRKCKIGPFARIRPGTRLKDEVEIGNFTEIFRTKVDEGSAIRHQTFLGDAVIGRGVKIGAGAVTANDDGESAHKTYIEDGVVVGSSTIIRAPARIKKRTIVKPGSVLSKKTGIRNPIGDIPQHTYKPKREAGYGKSAGK